YGPENALWEADGESSGFEWIDVDNALENIVSFKRRSPQTGRELICVCNFSAVSKKGYRIPDDQYELIISTDSKTYGGTDAFSLNGPELDLPPLTTLWLTPQKVTKPTTATKKHKRHKEEVVRSN